MCNSRDNWKLTFYGNDPESEKEGWRNLSPLISVYSYHFAPWMTLEGLDSFTCYSYRLSPCFKLYVHDHKSPGNWTPRSGVNVIKSLIGLIFINAFHHFGYDGSGNESLGPLVPKPRCGFNWMACWQKDVLLKLIFWSPEVSYCLVVALFDVKYILAFLNTFGYVHAKFLQQRSISEALRRVVSEQTVAITKLKSWR